MEFDWQLQLDNGMVFAATGDPASPVLRHFFEGYDGVFTLPGEREEFDGFRACLALNAAPRAWPCARTFECVAVLSDGDGRRMGGANFIAVDNGDVPGMPAVSINLNYVYVEASMRGRGLLRVILETVRRLAPTTLGVEANSPAIFIELNDPRRLTAAEIGADSSHAGIGQYDRIEVWRRMGAKRVVIDYVQPALDAGRPAEDSLLYAVIGLDGGVDPAYLSTHLAAFFGVSVLKGAAPTDDAFAAPQLAALERRAAAGEMVALDDLPAPPGDAMMAEAALPAPTGGDENRSVYWTVSFYLDTAALDRLLPDALNPDAVRAMLLRNPARAALDAAVAPLLNDIADREAIGRVDDFLIGADDDGSAVETLQMQLPGEIAWVTEGVRLAARPPNLARPRRLCLRRFWYVQGNGALSYHLSFAARYRHDPADFYFLSLLQKLTAPKEFALDAERLKRTVAEGRPASVLEAGLGIDPLDRILVETAGGGSERVWSFVARHFARDGESLLRRLAEARGMTPNWSDTDFAIDALVPMRPMIEVPGLALPQNRSMFFIQDDRFFDRIYPGDGMSRAEAVQEEDYAPYFARFRQLLYPPEAGGRRADTVRLGDDYWEWVTKRPEYDGLSDDDVANIRGGRHRDADGKAMHIPGFERGRPDCLEYFFLAGFNQNIIDFMNQDTSEILDSLDPIYPQTEEQEEEGFFVRFANPRALISYVRRSRSLDIGYEHIGTCPYAFLIHVVSLHNEFLARAREEITRSTVETVRRHIAALRFDEAENAINAFRVSVNARYNQQRYNNVFRYDTEAMAFERLEKLRGVVRKQQALDTMLSDLDSQTHALEARILRKEQDAAQARADVAAESEARMNRLIGGLGLFGAIGVLFQAGDYAQNISGDPGNVVTAALGAQTLVATANVLWIVSFACGVALTTIFGWAVIPKLLIDWLTGKGSTRRKK